MSEIIVVLLHYDFYDLSSSIIKLNSKCIAGWKADPIIFIKYFNIVE